MLCCILQNLQAVWPPQPLKLVHIVFMLSCAWLHGGLCATHQCQACWAPDPRAHFSVLGPRYASATHGMPLIFVRMAPVGLVPAGTPPYAIPCTQLNNLIKRCRCPARVPAPAPPPRAARDAPLAPKPGGLLPPTAPPLPPLAGLLPPVAVPLLPLAARLPPAAGPLPRAAGLPPPAAVPLLPLAARLPLAAGLPPPAGAAVDVGVGAALP